MAAQHFQHRFAQMFDHTLQAQYRRREVARIQIVIDAPAQCDRDIGRALLSSDQCQSDGGHGGVTAFLRGLHAQCTRHPRRGRNVRLPQCNVRGEFLSAAQDFKQTREPRRTHVLSRP